jgi:hypothetical protein
MRGCLSWGLGRGFGGSLLRGGCSLRETASGCRPDSRVPFLCFAKEKEPKERRPDGGGRPVADCSAVLGVWGLAPNSLRGLWPLRSDSRAKSVDEACCARGPKPLRSSTPPTGPKSNAVVASQLPHPRLASHRASEATRHRAMRSEPSLVFFSPSDELSSAGLCGARDSAHQELTSRRLSERSGRRPRSELGAAAKTEQRKAALAQRGPSRQGRFLCPLSLSTQRKGVGRRAEHPARPHAVNKSNNATAPQILDSQPRGRIGAT